MKYLIMLVVVSSCKQVDNSIVFQLEAGNGIVVQIHNNFEITTKLSNLKNSIVLEGKFFKFAVEEMKGYVQNSRQSAPLIPWEAVPPSSRQTVPLFPCCRSH